MYLWSLPALALKLFSICMCRCWFVASVTSVAVSHVDGYSGHRLVFCKLPIRDSWNWNLIPSATFLTHSRASRGWWDKVTVPAHSVPAQGFGLMSLLSAPSANSTDRLCSLAVQGTCPQPLGTRPPYPPFRCQLTCGFCRKAVAGLPGQARPALAPSPPQH